MQILLVAATEFETQYLREQFSMAPQNVDKLGSSFYKSQYHSLALDLLHTGVGMVNTAFSLGKYLANHQVDLSIQFGICGSINRGYPLGQVIEITEDTFSELGAESLDGFLDMQALGFPTLKREEQMYFNRYPNPFPSSSALPKVKALTLNKVHGLPDSIAHTYAHWDAEMESMEGAAFFQAMLSHEIPFLAFRGISNYVETRDKANWNIPLASDNCQKFVVTYVKALSTRA